MSTPSGIEPADVFFTRGGGAAGWVTRHGSGSHYAHTGIFHKLLRIEAGAAGQLFEVWQTVEAWPSRDRAADGVRWRTRTVPVTPAAVHAHELLILRTAAEPAARERLLAVSAAWAAADIRYGWGEIVRLGLRGVGIRLRRRDSGARAICSHHVTACVLAARPDLAGRLPVLPCEVWPGLLAAVLVVSSGVRAVHPYVTPSPVSV